jgi:CubicO group peptidase (beta-lactamase class C family)
MKYSRRRFLTTTMWATWAFANRSGAVLAENPNFPNLKKLFSTEYPTGVAVCIVKAGQVAFLGAHGWANREQRIPMSADTLINIASVTKTITATAIMQLVEAGKLDLDAPIDEYLSFVVRNPRFPDVPLTARQLLTHRSSLTDGLVYDKAYGCGDPDTELGEWLVEFLMPSGAFYDAEKNFHTWSPGTIEPPEESRPYSNVGYGLLGHIAESITGLPFTRLTKESILKPLGMFDSGWMLADIDKARHAIPYEKMPTDLSEQRADMAAGLWQEGSTAEPGTLRPVCLYGHPTYPDGFLRTSATDLSRFLLALTGDGELDGHRILTKSTLDTMLSNNHFGRALCWNSTTLGGRSATVWHHGGSDPGVMTMIGFRPSDRTGIIVLANNGDPGPQIRELILGAFDTTA